MKFQRPEVTKMFKKIVVGACFASVIMMVSAPANAAAYFIGGKWYYFSLDFQADLAKITGKDLRTGTSVNADVHISEAGIACVNPQGNFIEPGNGPKATLSGFSPPVSDQDLLTREDNKVKGNIYRTTAIVKLPKDPTVNPCKTSNGVASWKPLYWQNDHCDKAVPANQLGSTGNAVCYRELAAKNSDGALVYVTGPLTNSFVGNPLDWTFLYLPTKFKTKETLSNFDAGVYDTLYESCTFPINNEPLAAFPGTPYSLNNPPVDGWAATPPVYYSCGPITESEFNTN
jgi:hypothetical protein